VDDGAERDPEPEPRPDAHVSEGQLEAMISLLSDSSDKVVDGCVEALVRQGDRALLMLDQRLPLAQGREDRRIRGILARSRFPEVDAQLLKHLGGPAELEAGALMVARLVDGGPEPEEARGVLDRIADRADSLLMDDGNPMRQLGVLRRVIVEEYEIRGVTPGRARPLDALLHGVTANRRGMPLPLCIVWLLVARRLDIPLVGVNMPGHFLLRMNGTPKPVVIDAFSGGQLVDQRACAKQMATHGIGEKVVEDLDADDREMLLRTVRNLVHLAASDRDRQLALRGTRLLALESRARMV
jgi:regulator of sirC expression with transglutaminase-like and TPR domain